MSTELFEKGLKIRKDVLGKEFVENAIKNADEFSMPMQELTTEYCWGYVWGRPGLDKRTRSMLTIAMLVGQSRPDQLQNHIKGAIGNGVSKEEIREILLHAMLYVGLPAVSDSWRQATAALKEIGAY